MDVRSLSRKPEERGRGPDAPFLRPAPRPPSLSEPARPVVWSREDDKRAVEFLAGKAGWPGASSRVDRADAEVRSMDQRERVWLEIEMTRQTRPNHTAEYDPLVWGRS